MRDEHTLRPFLDGLGAHGDRPALIQMGPDGPAFTSYATLHANVVRRAAGILDRDLGEGRPVALYASTGPVWLEACLSLLAAGVVPVPLDMQLDTGTLEHILDDCDVRCVLTDRERAGRLESTGYTGRVVLLDADADTERSWHAIEAESVPTPPTRGPDDTAILFYTSGTTGHPKGVPLSQRNVAFQIQAIVEAGLVGENDRILQPLPLHHVYPLVVGTLAPLALGLPIVTPEAMLGPQIIAAIREQRVTFVVGVPRLYRALADGIEGRIAEQPGLGGAYLRAALALSTWLRRRLGLRLGKALLKPLHARLAPKLSVLASGGAALDPELAWRLEGLGWRVAVGYGLTETSPLLTINPPGNRALESVGRAAPGIDIRIDREALGDADDAGGEAGDGEILARGPGVFAGYLGRDEETAAAFTKDGWFRTGDLGRIDADGSIYITGRKNTLIVTSSGKNIQPDELEAEYAEHPCIDEIGICRDGDHLAAVVVPAAAEIRKRGMSIKDGVRMALAETAKRLPSYKKVSRHVLGRDGLPRTRLGKIKRHELAALYKTLLEAPEQSDRGAPLAIERMSDEDRALLDNDDVRAVWTLLTQNFPQNGLTPDTSFQMDLGIDSLGWLGLSTEIAERAGVRLDESRIAEIDTVRDLLGLLAQSRPAAGDAGPGSPLENPAAFLTEQQARWLEPSSGAARVTARGLYAFNRALAKLLFRLQVAGLDSLPADRQLLFAPNHASFLDAFAVAGALPSSLLERTYWGGWTGYAFRNRVFASVSRVVHIVPVDAQRAASSSLAFAATVLERGDNLVWFPEGARSPNGELLDFKPGIGMLLAQFPDVHVVPTWITGAYEAWPRDRAWPRLTRIGVTFGAPARGAALAEAGRGESERERIVAGLEAAVRALAE